MLRLMHHLSDDRLVAIALEASVTARVTAHLRDCAACAVRQARLAALLRDISQVAAGEADAAFPPEHLARQRARILSRVRHVTQPVAVLPFPGNPGDRPPSRRWIGPVASATAGLLLGVVAGQVAFDRPDGTVPAEEAAIEIVRPAPAILTRPSLAAATISGDELLLQIEAARQGPRPATLRSLDALTPRASELVSLQ